MRFICKRYISIVLLLVIVFMSLSGCMNKTFNSTDQYKTMVHSFADEYNYVINNEGINTQSYSVELLKNKEKIEFSFNLRDDSQYNSFDITCINPVAFDLIIEIANDFSRKKFSENFYNDILDGDNKFFNQHDENQAFDYDYYDFYRIGYLGISEDYCLEYYSYNDGEVILSLSGFTK